MKEQLRKYWKDTLWDIAIAIILLCLSVKLGIDDFIDAFLNGYGEIIIITIILLCVCIYEIRRKNKTDNKLK